MVKRYPPRKKLEYPWAHRRTRAIYERLIAAGGMLCARCHRPIDPAEPWDLDHDDNDRTRYLGPSHRRCNRATAW